MNNSMTNRKTLGRDRERGAIAIVMAALWMTLFGLAAFAVDIGYGYTTRRSVKAVADAALRAAMVDYNSGSTSGATTKAVNVLTANGYQNGVNGVTVTAAEVSSPTRFKVTLSVPQPSYFLKLFGISIGNVDVLSSGIKGTGGAAIFSNDTTACGTQWDNSKGIDFAGGGILKINGNIESKNKVHIGNPSGLCNGVNCQVTGAIRTSGCSIWNDSGTAVMGVASSSTTATLTDPMPTWATMLASAGTLCTQGNLTTTAAPITCHADASCIGGCKIDDGVYCSPFGINISPTVGTSICTTGATFISAGAITITGSGNITLNANSGASGIAVYSNYTTAMGGPAIQLSNGPSTLYTVNGHVYAPQGLVNVGTGTPGFVMSGTLGGKVVNISMGPNQPWTFTGSGGGSSWTAYE